MPKFQISDQNTGKKYVITAPDQASAVAAFQSFQKSATVGAPVAPTAYAPGNGGTSDPNDPYFNGLALPGRQQPPGAPPVNTMPPNQHFGFTSGDTLNPLPAISAFGDKLAANIPIAGPWLQSQRDKINASTYGISPEQSRASMDQTVAKNPEAATAGAVTGAVLPYAAAAEVPLLAGALGFEGPLALRAAMTGGSQFAINTGDNLAHGQAPEDAAKNAVIPALASVPFSVFGRASRAETPRSEAVKTLQMAGVPVTGGQARGSRGMMMAESQFGGSAAQAFRDKQLSAYTKAALKTAGISADRAAPEVMDGAFTSIGNKFDSLASMTKVRVDTQLQDGLLKSLTDFQDIKGESRPILDKLLNRVGTLAQQNGGTLQGNSYKAISTDISQALKNASDPELVTALHNFKDALDEGVARSMSGQTLEAWQKTRQQYANLMKITSAVGGAGQYAAQGLVTPEALSQAVRSGSKRTYTRGYGDLNALSRAGVVAMSAMPDSGTAGRLLPLLTAQGGVAHLMQGGNPLTAAAVAAGGMVAPFAAGRAMLSGPGRAILAKGTPVPATVARGMTPILLNGPR